MPPEANARVIVLLRCTASMLLASSSASTYYELLP
jgi:hypothetical protein